MSAAGPSKRGWQAFSFAPPPPPPHHELQQQETVALGGAHRHALGPDASDEHLGAPALKAAQACGAGARVRGGDSSQQVAGRAGRLGLTVRLVASTKIRMPRLTVLAGQLHAGQQAAGVAPIGVVQVVRAGHGGREQRAAQPLLHLILWGAGRGRRGRRSTSWAGDWGSAAGGGGRPRARRVLRALAGRQALAAHSGAHRDTLDAVLAGQLQAAGRGGKRMGRAG